jgi:hypothetical protein
VIRSRAIALVAFVALAMLGRGNAAALSEFCPVSVEYSPALPATANGQSAALVFELWARAPRTILSATIVADTDGGWYTWDVKNVPLSTLKTWSQSQSLVADFPNPVFVRHAWATKARASGDAFGWEALGEVACGVPGYLSAALRAAKPRPVIGLPHVSATAIAPLYSTDCPHPFAAAAVVHPVQPVYPMFVIKGASYSSQVEVAVGDHDNLLDAWVYKSSKNPAIDASALAASKASTYRSATSYCQKADADYLFRADFDPW